MGKIDFGNLNKAERAAEHRREVYKPLTEAQVEEFGRECVERGIGELFLCAEFSMAVARRPEHECALHQLYNLVHGDVAPSDSPSDSPAPFTSGWYMPYNARKAHYYDGSFSLCGKWRILGGQPIDNQRVGAEPGPDDCKACWRRLKAQEARGE